MVTTPNPNWPTLFAEGQFGGNPYFFSGTSATATNMSPRLYKTWGTQRGKQFELDSVQAGEFHGALINTDGVLDPSNTASALSPNVLPFRGFRVRAQYPPSINLLTADQATGGEGTPLAAGTVGTNYGVTGDYGNLVVAASGSAYQGTQVWQFTGTTGVTGLNVVSVQAAGMGPTDGLTYTMSLRGRSVTTGANPILQGFIRWVDASGNAISTTFTTGITFTGNPAASWTQVTLTATMPSSGKAVDAVFGLLMVSGTPPAGTWSFQVDGMQWEQNSSASAFTVPGASYALMSGLTERYPQDWNYTGTYGYVSPIVVDAMAMLSQTQLSAAFLADALALGPTFLYPLNDPAGSTSCAEASGKRPPAPIENSPYGAGSLVLGTGVTATTTAGLFVGTPGPVATFNNSTSLGAQLPQTFIGLEATTANPGPPQNGVFTRILHFRSTSLQGTNGGQLWIAMASPFGGVGNHSSIVQFSLTPTLGQANIVATGTVLQTGYQGSANLCDGNWHQMAMSIDGAGNVAIYIDGAAVTINLGGGSINLPFLPMSSDALGCYVESQGLYRDGYVGDMALVMEYPTVLTPTQISNLYSSWKSAYSGESSGSRYSRILNWAGYTGPTSIDTGSTTSMGPASDIVGIDALTALQNVVNTENGQHFIATNGTATFQARTRRYGQTTPVYIFGDANPLGAEIPYESVSFDFDTTHLSNLVEVTQTTTSQTFTASSSSSQISYGPRILTRDNQSTSSAECQDAAAYLVYRYKDPHMRVATLRLHPSSNPSVLFPVCLSLELGMRVRVMRRPPAPAATIQLDGFIEAIIHTPSDTGEWYTDVQISSADTLQYWQLAALHTTLHAQATSGTNTATINALPDAAVNKLAQSLPSGYQLTFEPGTVRQETLTLAAGGIPSTALSYTSATLTFTSNFAFTHAINTVVCEPLPAGFTDPTTWDAVSILGASYTTVLSGGGSGTNNVTVNPLSDSASNGLSSDWVVGDTLWLSPGTGNFETAVIQSIATTYARYTSATITFTANLTHSHAVGDFVCEPLPGGQTNPSSLTPAPTARLAY